MENHPIKTAPVAKFALIAGLALLALTVFILLNSLKNTVEKNSVKGDIDVTSMAENKASIAAVNLKPVGKVTVSDGSGAAPSSARSGEEVYTAVCASCHASGAAGAPKIDDKAAWEPRVANGFNALLKTAIDGKGAMPPRAGRDVPDDELTTAIAYMTEKAGFSLDIPKAEAPSTEEKAAEPATEPAPEAATTEEKAAEPVTEPASETPATEEKAAEPVTEPALEAATTEEKAAEPATEPASEAPTTEEKAAEPAQAAETEAANQSAIDGQKLYKSACFVCHDTGAANAPKITDKAIWQPRVALGKDALYNTAINGKGAMPPKGGRTDLSDDEVKAVVDYMLSVVQ